MIDLGNPKVTIELYDLGRTQQQVLSSIVYETLVAMGINVSSYSVALDVEYTETEF
jgi:hypothetical protein